ncbi:hypothetical protein Tco_0661001 [Tanacetum coccineum]
MEGFNKLVEDAWNEAPVDESNAMSNMMKKLKYLKQKIRDWNKGNMKSSKNIKAKLKDDLKAVDDIIDNGESKQGLKDLSRAETYKIFFNGLVNGLPSKLFTNEHNCVACNKGKQHKASYKAITAVSTISEPLQVWKTADTVPAGSGVPATSIPAGSINQAASGSAVPSTPSSSVVEPVYVDDTPLPPGHSLGSSENSTRFSSPSDLANHISSSSEMEGIHHHPTTGIFSESTYDADFGGSATNLAPTIAVDHVPTRRVHTVHHISQIIRDITSPVLTRGTLKKSNFGESALAGYVHDQQ